ncbi:MAG: aminoacyl-histidine dipeptidase [Planctomycetes bacterium]|nr:aminoacyl-histidine dipeptidase [Planctomycetota bacterium]
MTSKNALELEPAGLWGPFLDLSRIPRGSGNETAAAKWFADRARAAGCEVLQDKVGNVLARKKAQKGREGAVPVVLQCHVDMVCEKNEATAHDFRKDPIQVWRDGDMLRARGTTLGADNGIGVASALAVLESKGVAHGPLEVLVTVDEETGMTGAKGLAGGWIKGKWLINLDSEEEGELTIGCAGGVDTVASRTVQFGPAPAGTALRVKVGGLKGGHSGIDIEKGRANALKVLAQVLDAASGRCQLALASFAGGNKRNAIAREAAAVVVVPAAEEAALRSVVQQQEAAWRGAYGALDPGLAITVAAATADRVMTAADAQALVSLVLAGPHGVEAMSPDIPGLVQTSTNLGIVAQNGETFDVCFLSRSAIDASKYALAARIAAACRLAGFVPAESGGYPGWKPEPKSNVVAHIQAVHGKVAGKPMIVKAIHAGLECGLIGENYPGMEMASIGPSMWDVHTPDEHVSISSVGRFWTLLQEILARVPAKA